MWQRFFGNTARLSLLPRRGPKGAGDSHSGEVLRQQAGCPGSLVLYGHAECFDSSRAYLCGAIALDSPRPQQGAGSGPLPMIIFTEVVDALLVVGGLFWMGRPPRLAKVSLERKIDQRRRHMTKIGLAEQSGGCMACLSKADSHNSPLTWAPRTAPQDTTLRSCVPGKPWPIAAPAHPKQTPYHKQRATTSVR